MTKIYKVQIAALVGAASLMFAVAAFAAVPVGPAGYWALDENGGATANDSSGNGNTGAINGGAAYTTSGIPATPGNVSALTFDGVDDFVSVPNSATLDVTAPYSLSAWVNVTDIATYRPILFRGATDANDIEVYVQPGSGDLIVAHNRGNGGTFDFVGFDNPPVGSLFHLVVTYDGTNVLAYYDGVAAAVVQESTAMTAPSDTNKDWWIGKVDHSAFPGAFFFSGLLDEVLIYGRVLTTAEIAALETASTILNVDDDGMVGFDNSCDGTDAMAYTTIQAAVNAASAGNTIKVCPGIYPEHVSINKSLNLEGPNSGIACLAARGAEAEITGGATGAVQILADNVTINGFKVSSASNALGAGIWTPAGGSIMGFDIKNNLITGNQIGMIAGSDGASSIRCNIFDANNESGASGGTGIYSEVTNALTIDNNEFKNHTVNHPLNFAAAGASVHDSLTVSNNIFAGTNAFGIRVMGVDIGSFTGNDIDTNDATGLVIDTGNAHLTITGNTIHDNWQGLRIRDDSSLPASSDIHINRNAITGNIDSGIFPGFGVNNESGYTGDLDAECNWWGAADGPGPVGPGSGDKVSTLVDFTSWLTTSDLVSGPCDGPLPSITVVKTVVNDNGGTNVVGDFPLFIDAMPVVSGATTTLAVGSYTVSETPQAGYTAGAWGGDCAADGTITLAPNQVATCTITNDDQPASLTLNKVVVNDNGGTATPANWTMTATGPTGFSGFGPSVTNAGVDAGTYDLSENGPAGYTASDWVCVGGNQTDGDSIEIGPGENVSCTITNDDQPAKLIVIKHVINDNGGTALASAFKLDSGGTDDTPDNFAGAESPGTTVTLDAGSYSVTETGPAGYIQSNSADCSGTIGIGETKTCTITNDDVPPPPANACATPLVAPAGYTLQNGTAGNNVVTLAPFTMFVGNGGNDTVTSNKNGNYIVCTLAGNDVIRLSGAGAVTIDAGNGRNTVALGNMTGFITTGTGVDVISAGNGARTINAGDGNNTVTTGSGDQMITTGSGDDNIFTNGGNDTINAGAGKNKVFSKGGNDSLTALGGNDFFDAGAGADTCNAGGGSNTVLNCAP